MKKQLTLIAASFLFSGTVMAQKVDINTMPQPGPTPSINITQPKTFQLKNGMTVMIVENHKLPKVNVSLSMDRPPIYEGRIAGVNSIMASQLGNGTATISKDNYNKRVDYLGARIGFSSAGAFANSLSKYFPEVLNLMADAAINPKFSEDEIKKSKDRTIEGIKASEKDASSILNKISGAITYGKNSALGEFKTPETINAITLADVQDAYNKYFVPNNAYLVVVGDVNFNDAKKLIEKAFGNWKKSSYVIPAVPAANNVAKTEIDVIDVPNAVQSVIDINNITTLKMKDPQYFASTISNYILGGGSEGRLFMNLREKNGFTYGAYSSLDTSKYDPSFSASASVRNEVTDKAVKEFMNELNGISMIKPEELASAKSQLKGDFIRSMESPETIAVFAVNTISQNLPKDFYTNYLKSIDNVTIADAQNAAKTTILPNQSRVFIAGKAAEISDGLEKLGYTVNYYDKDANKIAKPVAKKVDANTTITTVGDNYIKAIGGATAVSKVTSKSMEASAKIQGMDMLMTLIQAKGGKSMMDMKMMGNSVQKMVFDGKQGYMQGQGKKIDIPEAEKKELMKETELFPELTFGKSADYKLAGIEKYNNEDAYAVKNDKTTLYYSVATGLKIGEVKSTPQGSIPTVFSDYKDVQGIKLPFKISQNMGGMDIVFDVKSYKLNEAEDADFK